MNILVVNDDGIHAPGLEMLATSLSQVADVTVVAPAREHSGASGALTVHSILQVEEIYKHGRFFGYSVDGTPTDCVKLALFDLLDHRPDFIFAGINPGANLSINVYYSGTVSAASEGLMHGITGCAVSLSTYQTKEIDYAPAAAVALRWLEIMKTARHNAPVLYNINVPPLPFHELKGFAPSYLTRSAFKMLYEKRFSPSGGVYYWLSDLDLPKEADEETGSDIYSVKNGYVSVTPLIQSDRTAYHILKNMQKMDI